MENNTYFSGLNNVEAIKTRFRDLAKKHHPDLGCDAETVKTINMAYQEALKACNGQQQDEERTYHYKADVEAELMNKLLDVLKLRSLDIALIGYWIWVSGDTKKNKDALKASGFLWDSKRKCLYYKPKGWKRTYQSNGNLSELASKYGYEGFKTADQEYMPTIKK